MPRHNLVPVTDEQHVEDEPAKGSDGINSREDSAKVSACKSTTHDHKAGTRELHLRTAVCTRHTSVHQDCLMKGDPDAYFGKNLLSIPCLLGWKRHIVKQSKKSKWRVVYIAPCRRWLRDITEVADYLNLCKPLLTVDLFRFDSLVNVFCEFVPETVKTFVEDIAYG
ncbi:histone-lysine N-methyltransferase met-2-like [Dermacentor silvarum]|uniref:histone-lysine N-methyltransferase met-2-like n=1 Tax=Dermacentor silvarum TaxID=543639 RepID=UPI002101BC25|nr:histone-lysine N-methyltransferase met-2-like [Dermacentor silvarum]